VLDRRRYRADSGAVGTYVRALSPDRRHFKQGCQYLELRPEAPWGPGPSRTCSTGPPSPARRVSRWCGRLRRLPDELRTVGTLLALDHIGRDVDLPPQHRQRSEGSRPQRRRLMVVEAWQLMRDGEGPVPVPDVQGGPQTQPRLVDGHPGRGRRPRHRAECCSGVEPATQVALRQAPQAIDAVGDAFGLTAGKRRKLLGARIGQGLLIAGTTGPRSRRCARQRRTGCVRQIPGSTVLKTSTASTEGSESEICRSWCSSSETGGPVGEGPGSVGPPPEARRAGGRGGASRQ
jgi:hypothetical protein